MTYTHRPKIAFVCNIEEGIHWKLYLDDVWKGDFLHLEAAIDHIYSITGREIWGDRLIRYGKKYDDGTHWIWKSAIDVMDSKDKKQ